MAMYYQGGSEIQADGLQTLYLMNPNYAGGYSDAQQQPANMVILNYATGNTVNLASLASNQQPQTQHLVGVPLQGSLGSAANSHELKHEVSAPGRGGIPHFHPSLWGSLDHTGGAGAASQPNIPSGVVVSNPSGGGAADVTRHLGFHRPVVSPRQQGLSLSLSSQQPGFRSLSTEQNISVQTPVGILSPRSGDNNLRGSGGSSSSVSAVSNGIHGLQSAVFGSKYLKAAQQLLDELVNVGKEIKSDTREKAKDKGKMNRESTVHSTGEASQIGQSDTKSGVTELTAAQRQEIQMKKAKLVSMLDEVEQRYRQYHHQMQIVVASFEQAAGIGSAKSYTQLALQTISKQFRCLKDAISAQIKSASKSLGEEESLGGKLEGSRLKFVDQQLRQQRALQQLGMMQNNTWRPQRGLPERAVSVLRAWLFEHFLHPYPKDSDKQMLAKQTGLTRSQVSNWFINARVRLWKPMVEEMYLEETKNHEQDGSESNKELGSTSTTPKENNVTRIDQRSILQSKQEKQIAQDATHAEISTSSLTPSPTGTSPQARGGFGLIGALNMEANVEKNSKKMRTEMQNSPSSILSVDMEMKFGEPRKGFDNKFSTSQRETNKDGFSLMVNNAGQGNGFGAFNLGELGQFNPEQLTTGFHGNSVSLTLGLPPSENLALSAGTQQNYLSDQNMGLEDRLEMGTMDGHYDRVNKTQTSHSSLGYETINFDNRKRFAAQLLPDFVT
ncbi:BEL1-like homeodomain protein 1 [Coffea arabica]|uniref:BEL1-like homeodomain protein 1 n=1 Tax=Coffea arabica TaxID=13443 RepID=A0A6P6TWV3_COFAR